MEADSELSGRGGRVLTTVPSGLPAVRALDWSASRLDGVDCVELAGVGALRRLLRDAAAYDSILLNGSGRLNQIAAALLVHARSSRAIVISDSTWQRGTWWLDRLITRVGMKAIDSPHTTYCVHSRDEVASFPRTWGVDASRVVFTPFCFTLTEGELAAPTSTRGGVFAGGDSLRDYGPLLEAAKTTAVEVTVAARGLPGTGDEPSPNVHVKAVPHARFIELMRHARLVVVPLKGDTERSAGQTTYLNAMALGKLVIATDSPGVRDYIQHGATGLVVAPGDAGGMASALTWALDPANEHAVAEIATRARAVALSRFRPVDYFRSLVDVATDLVGASVNGAPVRD